MHSLRTYVFHVAGDPDNGHMVNIILQARNTRGATVRTTCQVVVPPQNFTNQEMKNASEEISEKMNQNKMPEVRGGYQKVTVGARGFSYAVSGSRGRTRSASGGSRVLTAFKKKASKFGAVMKCAVKKLAKKTRGLPQRLRLLSNSPLRFLFSSSPRTHPSRNEGRSS